MVFTACVYIYIYMGFEKRSFVDCGAGSRLQSLSFILTDAPTDYTRILKTDNVNPQAYTVEALNPHLERRGLSK